MRNFIARTVGALALVTAAVPAAAQDKAVASKSDIIGVQKLQSVGHCIASLEPEGAHEFVTIHHRSERYKELAEELSDAARRGCADFARGIRASGLIFAGTIAEGLMIDRGMLEELALHTAFDPELPPISANGGEEVMAYCVVRKNPDGVAALLATGMNGDEEMAALKALAGTLPTCVPAGQTPKFTREALRAIIALSAYRLAAHREAHAS